VTIATFWDALEANIARNFLERAGIQVILSDELTSVVWGLGHDLGGVKVQVPADQAALAQRLLSDHATKQPPPSEREPHKPSRWKPWSRLARRS
jgi:hypothetical protein